MNENDQRLIVKNLNLKKAHMRDTLSIRTWKLEIEGTLSAVFVIKTPRSDCCFVSMM